ncbi:MAG: hypothetical protein H6553_05665 [Chitinophagales bacterium]|nr:hypothetical protein [Chitinophagales bacterium]
MNKKYLIIALFLFLFATLKSQELPQIKSITVLADKAMYHTQGFQVQIIFTKSLSTYITEFNNAPLQIEVYPKYRKKKNKFVRIENPKWFDDLRNSFSISRITSDTAVIDFSYINFTQFSNKNIDLLFDVELKQSDYKNPLNNKYFVLDASNQIVNSVAIPKLYNLNLLVNEYNVSKINTDVKILGYGNKKPDSYFIIKYPAFQEFKSKVFKNTLQVENTESSNGTLTSNDSIKILFYDRDKITFDDFLDKYEFSINELLLNKSSVINVNLDAINNLEITYTIKEATKK